MFLNYYALIFSSPSSSVRSPDNRCNRKRHSRRRGKHAFMRPLLKEATQKIPKSLRVASRGLRWPHSVSRSFTQLKSYYFFEEINVVVKMYCKTAVGRAFREAGASLEQNSHIRIHITAYFSNLRTMSCCFHPCWTSLEQHNFSNLRIMSCCFPPCWASLKQNSHRPIQPHSHSAKLALSNHSINHSVHH